MKTLLKKKKRGIKKINLTKIPHIMLKNMIFIKQLIRSQNTRKVDIKVLLILLIIPRTTEYKRKFFILESTICDHLILNAKLKSYSSINDMSF